MQVLIVAWLAGCGGAHRYPDGSGLEGQLDREVVALRQRVSELEDQLANGAAPGLDPLVAELHQVFSGTAVVVGPSPGGAVLTVPAEVVFADVGALRIRGESTIVFDLLATATELHPAYELLIVGHTSDRPAVKRRGTAPVDPLAATALQAAAFAHHLHAHHGVPLERLVVVGRGPYQPIASNDIPEGQAANERLEVVFARTERSHDWL